MKLEQIEEETVETGFVPGESHQSGPGIMQGGLTATMADELMGRCVNAMGYAGVTVRMELRYRSSVPIDQQVIFQAKVIKTRLPVMDLECNAILPNGKVALEASARFMIKGSFEEFCAMLEEQKKSELPIK